MTTNVLDDLYLCEKNDWNLSDDPKSNLLVNVNRFYRTDFFYKELKESDAQIYTNVLSKL